MPFWGSGFVVSVLACDLSPPPFTDRPLRGSRLIHWQWRRLGAGGCKSGGGRGSTTKPEVGSRNYGG
eukprot:3416221-Rhodomonas_salina.2